MRLDADLEISDVAYETPENKETVIVGYVIDRAVLWKMAVFVDGQFIDLCAQEKDDKIVLAIPDVWMPLPHWTHITTSIEIMKKVHRSNVTTEEQIWGTKYGEN